MKPPLRLGIAGLGTVGIGVVKIVQNHADLLSRRTGREIAISAVSASSRNKARSADILVFLGLGTGTHPALDAIELTVYLDCDAGDDLVDRTFADTLARSPVLQSLERFVPVRPRWRSVPS